MTDSAPEILSNVIEGLNKTLDNPEIAAYLPAEIVIVDSGSSDGMRGELSVKDPSNVVEHQSSRTVHPRNSLYYLVLGIMLTQNSLSTCELSSGINER